MKNLFPITSLVLLCFIFNVCKAQTDQSAPTKQDALNFINQICAKYPQTGHIPGSSHSYMNATLDGCILVFHWSSTYSSSSMGNTYGVDYENETIDLSSVYTKDKQIKSNVTGDLYLTNGIKTMKFNGKVKDDTGLSKRIDYQFNPFYFINSYAWQDAEFTDKNYGDRFIKAIEFLIKSCGGGKVKVDSNDKF